MTRAEAELAVHGFQAGDPEAGGLVVLLGLLPLVALQILVVRLLRLFAVAVVRLVVEHEDVLHAHQVGHHALEHLAFGFERVRVPRRAPLKQRAAACGKLDALAQLEGVVVGDDDLGPVHVVEHVAGNEFAAGVVAVGIVRLEDAQPVLDRQARRDDQKAAREMLAAGPAHGVDRLPGDQHRHDGGLAGAGGQLQREPHQLGIGVLVGGGEMIENALAARRLRRDLGQPDRRLHRFDLAEERADAAELVMPPVLEQAGRFRRDLPLAGIGQGAPVVHMAAHLVDDRGGIVLLLGCRKPLALVENNLLLLSWALSLLRLGDRRDELGAAPPLDDLLRRLAVLIQFPMARRAAVGRIQDRVVEERVGHSRGSSFRRRRSPPTLAGVRVKNSQNERLPKTTPRDPERAKDPDST